MCVSAYQRISAHAGAKMQLERGGLEEADIL